MQFKSDKFIQDTIELICNNEDVKNNIKSLFKPLLPILLKEVYPYIWISLIVIFTLFVFNIILLLLILQIKTTISKCI